MANLHPAHGDKRECDFKMRVANGGLGKANHFFDFQGEKGLWEIHLRLNCTFLLNMQLQKLLKIKLSPTPFVSKLRNCFHKILLVERT
jgi:hypothetical protein